MPLPMITKAVMAATKPIEDGYSLLTLVDKPRSAASAKGTSTNYFFEFEALSGPGNSEENAGRRTTFMVNGAGLEQGINEVCASYFSLLSALTGLPSEELVDAQLNEEEIVGKKVWAEISSVTVDGKIYKRFNFYPPNEQPF